MWALLMDELLRDIVLIFLAAGGLLHLMQRLRLPAIVGLLIAGVILGPYGLGIVRDGERIEQLADIGIILLMFSIGLDFTGDRLRQLLRASRLGVSQIAFCILVTAALSILFVDRWAVAMFLGFLVAHTSSALMLKQYIDRKEIHTPQARVGVGISITQDLSVMPMLLAVPFLARGEWALGDFGLDLLKMVAALAVAVVLARWVVPFWLHRVMQVRSRELFLIFLVVVCLGTAWATLAVGLPTSLGAFIAGLAVANTPYSHQTLAEVAPLRDLLVSVFFISIGMLLNLAVMGPLLLPAVGVIVVVLALKFLSGFLPVLLGGYPVRIAALVGLAMAQLGEFAFVLLHAGREAGLIADALFQFFVMVAIVTMLLNPFLLLAGPRVSGVVDRMRWLRRLERRQGDEALQAEAPPLENHIVICGYGLNGRNIVRALEASQMPYAVLELNPETVQQARAEGVNIYYGDATRTEILRQVGLEAAHVYVVGISDAQATRQTVQLARRENPALHIIVRTKNLDEIDILHELGADQVIAEEFETSLEILARALRAYNLSRLQIEQAVQDLRGGAYEPLRGPRPLPPRHEVLGELLPALEIETVDIVRGSPAIGRTLGELDLRSQTGATLLAVRRDGRLRPVPPPQQRVEQGDVLVLAGSARQILAAVRLLEPEKSPPDENAFA